MHRRFKIALVGDASVGKTALALSLVTQMFIDVNNDPGFDLTRVDLVCLLAVDRRTVELDVGDADDLASARAVVLVCDLTRRATFDALPRLHQSVLRARQAARVPCVVVANKSDLQNDVAIAADEVGAWATAIGAPFFQVSAKRRDNVEEAFAEAVRQEANLLCESTTSQGGKRKSFWAKLLQRKHNNSH